MAGTAGASGGATSGARRGSGLREGARLAALHDLGLLDTPAEEDFDRYTRLATEILGVPVSLVTLVDADRQFFKSQVGLSEPYATARQTPLSHSFCQHCVTSGEPLVVEDARGDPLLSGNLAVSDMEVVAYAGMPLVLSDGHAVGALCAIDARPHRWTERELLILADLAAALRSQLDLRRSLAEQGLRDRLTGLPNRALLAAQADVLQRESEAGGAADAFAVCLGVDAFGLVNEAHGNAVADRLLREAGERLAAAARDAGTVGRIGGDVFAVIGCDPDPLTAAGLAAALCAALAAEPFSEAEAPIGLTATAGHAVGASGERGADLLARASEAMRAAKSSRAAEGSLPLTAAVDRLRLRTALPGAARRGELEVVYQAIAELDSGCPAAYEALLRWEAPGLGRVSPAAFVPLAERTGAIVAIGEWVLGEACAQAAAWRAAGAGVRVSVNLSPVQLRLPELVPMVRGALNGSALPASALQLEITEGAVVGAGELELANLQELRALGVTIALDDFGTGYSSLGYLTRLPIDAIKLDKSFVDPLESSRACTALVRAVVALAEGLELAVVAEGVERPGQRDALRALGCRLGQGRLFAPPLPGAEIDPGRAAA